MKKRLFISSILMTLVLLVAITTATFAWYQATTGAAGLSSTGTNQSVTISAPASISQDVNGVTVTINFVRVDVNGYKDSTEATAASGTYSAPKSLRPVEYGKINSSNELVLPTSTEAYAALSTVEAGWQHGVRSLAGGEIIWTGFTDNQTTSTHDNFAIFRVEYSYTADAEQVYAFHQTHAKGMTSTLEFSERTSGDGAAAAGNTGWWTLNTTNFTSITQASAPAASSDALTISLETLANGGASNVVVGYVMMYLHGENFDVTNHTNSDQVIALNCAASFNEITE